MVDLDRSFESCHLVVTGANDFGDDDVMAEGFIPLFLMLGDFAHGDPEARIEFALWFEFKSLFRDFVSCRELTKTEEGFCLAVEKDGSQVSAFFSR